MSQLNLKKQLPAVNTTPPTGYVALYYDSGTSSFKYEDETGAFFNFNSTVTTVSVVTANGLAGTVATATTTPAITLSTTVTGVLKGNGTAISAATVGTDYSVGTSALTTGLLKSTTGTGALTIAISGTDYQPAGNYITALSGDVVTTGPGAVAGTIQSNVVTNAKLAQMAANTIKGNNTGGTTNALDLTTTQVTAMLNLATQSLQGLESASDKKKSDIAWYSAVADIGLDPTGTTDNLTLLNNFLSTIAVNSTVYFSKGTYNFSGTISIPSGKHVNFKGDGQFKSIIQTTSGTADIVLCGDWQSEFRDLQFSTSVTRTAGYAINGGSNVYIFVQSCNFVGMFNGILQNGTLCGIDKCNFAGTVNFSIQTNGTNVNGYISECTFDGLSPAAVSHIEVNQAGSLLVSDCDIIHGQSNMRINPTNPNGAFSVYCINTFFDTSSGSSLKFLGTGNAQRAKFVNCWFSGSVNGVEFASTATNLPTAIDFVNCDIYSNSANGILATSVQDFSLSNCRIAGNTTAGINLAASAGAVTKMNVQNNTVGPTGGIGGNGTGILINSGTYGGYIVTGNNVSGNTTANITDSGSVSGQNQKQIQDNLGHQLAGKEAAIVAASAGINTTETIVTGGLNVLPVPANSIMPGTSIRITLSGTCVATAAVANTFRVRLGTAGTTADTQIASVALTGATGTQVFKTVLEFTFRTVGASGTIAGSALTVNAAATGIVAAVTNIQALTVAAPNTTTANYLSVTFQSAATTSTVTFQTAIVEILT